MNHKWTEESLGQAIAEEGLVFVVRELNATPQLLEALRNIARGMTNGQLERGETPQSIARAAIAAAGGG